MVPLFVLFLVALEVIDVSAVGLYKVSVSAKGTTKCNGGPFDRSFFAKGAELTIALATRNCVIVPRPIISAWSDP